MRKMHACKAALRDGHVNVAATRHDARHGAMGGSVARRRESMVNLPNHSLKHA
jgi:uncharacterized protein YbjT (DUF2867 family)